MAIGYSRENPNREGRWDWGHGISSSVEERACESSRVQLKIKSNF